MDLIGIVITVLGTIGSLVGAYIALKEAKKAKSSAEKAEEIRNTIATEQRKISLSELLTETKKIMTITIKMATSASPDKKLSGLNYQKSIEQIRKFIDVLKEYCHYISIEKINEVEQVYKAIEDKLVKLATEPDQKTKYGIGDDIHKSMGEIVKIIKPELDINYFAKKNLAILEDSTTIKNDSP